MVSFPGISTQWSPDVLGTVTVNNDRPLLLRFHKIMFFYPTWKVPFLKHTYSLEQTCSVISNSLIPFFRQTLLSWHVPYIFMAPLLISQLHFFYFCNTCLFLQFQNYSDVTRGNIFYYIAVWLQSPFATCESLKEIISQNR